MSRTGAHTAEAEAGQNGATQPGCKKVPDALREAEQSRLYSGDEGAHIRRWHIENAGSSAKLLLGPSRSCRGILADHPHVDRGSPCWVGSKLLQVLGLQRLPFVGMGACFSRTHHLSHLFV
jgi:hypothetical protein